MPASATLPWHHGLKVFERGWLSSNNLLLLGEAGEGAVLVDASHTLHAAQTVAMMHAALGGEPLRRLVNTHLHSDHCGGNAALVRNFGCRLEVPPGEFAAARAWDEPRLSHHATGQTCERFRPDGLLSPGDTLAVGGRRWQVLAAPGHDPHSVLLFDHTHGVLVSADALWEQGFGVIFPELDGEAAFDEQAAILNLIEGLAPRWVVPGHGRPFDDVAGALARARTRLDGFVRDPARHRQHGARVLVKNHLMERRQEHWDEFRAWFEGTPLTARVWQGLGRPEGRLAAWGEVLVKGLVASGALALQEDLILDR